MLYSSLFLLPAFELLAQATESYSPLSTSSRRRQLATCDQTYGNGSIPCGGLESTWCFNPNLGQTCCQLDGGFCNDGSYCAPVAGYCCLEDEDVAACAERAGFDLPNAAVNGYNTNPDPIVATQARVSRTFTVTPFLTAHPGPTPIDVPDSDIEPYTEPFDKSVSDFLTEFTVGYFTACRETPSASAPVVIQIANASTSSSHWASMSTSSSAQATASVSPLVQVSTATKEKEGRIGSFSVIAIAGLFAVFL
ncbi:hypothetical protein F5Y12DRAFT_719378 [Xylaria sp. FL1777]|nr:hypothetical protein F5Y12DRAFT_719378 [Xylaria sp. FL1777]